MLHAVQLLPMCCQIKCPLLRVAARVRIVRRPLRRNFVVSGARRGVNLLLPFVPLSAI